MPLTRPTNLQEPFAAAGLRNTVPTAATGSNLASYDTGFPPVTMQPISSGGIPPDGKDFNGVLYDISSHTLWVNAGGQYRFDAALAAAIGGYPVGMVLQNDAGTASYISAVNNNAANFNTSPNEIGVSWLPYAGQSFSSITINVTGGILVLTAIQAAADLITVTGTLTGTQTLVFPITPRRFVIKNATTGNFTLSARTVGGAALPIRQGSADAFVCDSTNLQYDQADTVTRSAKDNSTAIASTSYADRAASRVGEYCADTGTAGAVVVATTPATSTYADGQTVRFTPAFNCPGASTLNAGAGALPLVREDGGALRQNDYLTTNIVTATYRASTNNFVINGPVPSEIAIGRLSYITATQNLSPGSYDVNTTAGPFACNLPSTPLEGDAIDLTDVTGTWEKNPLTVVATGGKSITVFSAGRTLTDTTLVCNSAALTIRIWYDGTHWRLY